MAQRHPLINNCLHCGRIVCEIEGAGPCFFCGNIVVGKNSKETYEEDLEFFTKLDEDPILQESYFKALENKDKLLGYEKTMDGTKNIVDDEVDWYEIKNDVWQDKTVRQEAMKRVLQHESEDPTGKTRTVFDIDKRTGKLTSTDVRVCGEQDRKDEMKRFLAKIEKFEREKRSVMGLIEQQTFEDEKVSKLVKNVKKQYQHLEEKQKKKTTAVDKAGELSSVQVPDRGWNKKIQHDDEYLAFEKLLQQNMDDKRQQANSREGKDEDLYNLRHCYVPKCMTLWQPWASLIVYGIKRFEGRMWNSGYRGPLWIHAASREPAKEDIQEVESFYREMFRTEREKHPSKYKNVPEPVFPKRYPTSCLIGIVDVQDVWPKQTFNERFPKYLKKETSNDFVFVLRNPKRLPIPIKCKGSREIYEIPKDRARIAEQGLRFTRSDFCEYFAKEFAEEKAPNKAYHQIRYVNISKEFGEKKKEVFSEGLQKIWENGGLVDFSEKDKKEDEEPQPEEPVPAKETLNIEIKKKKKKRKRKKKGGQKANHAPTPRPPEEVAKPAEPAMETADEFPSGALYDHIREEKDFETGKVIMLADDAMAGMAIGMLKRLKKSLKNGFENLKSFDLGFFESPNFENFVKFLIRTQYSMRSDGVFADLEGLLTHLRFDAVKYVNFRKWRRIERKYQMIYVVGDGVKVTDDSRKAFIPVLDNQVFVVDQDHCEESFLLKELKTNERKNSSNLKITGDFSSFLMCFYFLE